MTVGPPRLALSRCRRPSAILAAIALALSLVGCEDRGGSFVADNRSDVTILVRIKSTLSAGSGLELAYEVVEVPASSRLVIAYQGFADVKQVNAIEVLLETCESLGSFFGFSRDGRVIVVEDGPAATLVREWPQETEPKAAVVDKCPVAEGTPSP